MKMTGAPSQVMREGRDLNQHGQAGRQEQASSSSPVTFQGVLAGASAALTGTPNAPMPHRNASETTDLPEMICFINLSSHFFETLSFARAKMYSRKARGQ